MMHLQGSGISVISNKKGALAFVLHRLFDKPGSFEEIGIVIEQRKQVAISSDRANLN